MNAAPSVAAEARGRVELSPTCDPGGAMRRAFAGEGTRAPSPREVLVRWLVELPPGLDPAHAAAALLAYWRARGRGPADPFAAELAALLAAVAAHPAEVLAQRARRRRRR